jgi:Icc-related predicted phosphoesterase
MVEHPRLIMRVLASADVHGNRQVYEWLLATSREHRIDALILGGDLLGCPDGFTIPEDAQRHDAQLLSDLLGAAGLPVFYIMGNDDLVELDSGSENVQSIQGHRIQLGRYNFLGYQYSLPFMGGTFEKPEDDIKADLAGLDGLMDGETIFVSHSPALGILDPGFDDSHIGSSSLREFLERNSFRAHLHGHSHAGFGCSGKHFNVASAGLERALILDLDTMQHQFIGTELGFSGMDDPS